MILSARQRNDNGNRVRRFTPSGWRAGAERQVTLLGDFAQAADPARHVDLIPAPGGELQEAVIRVSRGTRPMKNGRHGRPRQACTGGTPVRQQTGCFLNGPLTVRRLRAPTREGFRADRLGHQPADFIFSAFAAASSIGPTYMNACSGRWSHLPSHSSWKLRSVSARFV